MQVVFELSFIYIAVAVDQFAFAVFHVLLELALIIVAIGLD